MRRDLAGYLVDPQAFEIKVGAVARHVVMDAESRRIAYPLVLRLKGRMFLLVLPDLFFTSICLYLLFSSGCLAVGSQDRIVCEQ